MKKKILAISIITIIILQSFPLKELLPDSIPNSNLKNSDTPFIPPDDKEVIFSDFPYIFFSIDYEPQNIFMEIDINNTLNEPISLFNLWIQVNKSHPSEKILIENTEIVDDHDKLSLSTFDTHVTDGFNGSMIFHIKLYEGEVISLDEKFKIKLNWFDPDTTLAQYDPNLIPNEKADDIQVFFQYSTRLEDYQPFPLIEREYYQEYGEGFMVHCVDFKITNLMELNLDTFEFSYIKFKDYPFEQYLDFSVESPFLTPTEISDISLIYQNTNDKINFSLYFGGSIELQPNEWLKIKTKWIGLFVGSSIRNDLIIWNIGDTDYFNKGKPFYAIGYPYYPILSPAEPVALIDYDFDGLRNYLELANGFDPFTENIWLNWESLRSDYFLAGSHAYNLPLMAEVMIIIPESYFENNLSMKITDLGPEDELFNIEVNDELKYSLINNIGEFILANPANDGFYNLKFTLKHKNPNVNSFYEIDFYLNGIEIPDLTHLFQPDSDGDGLFDMFEANINPLIPDTDSDGVLDGADIMPTNYLNYGSNAIFTLNVPIKDLNSDSDISLNLQIKPTQNDYTETYPYAGNTLMIMPGIKIYGESSGGDYLPDNSFSLDKDKTGIVYFIPLKRGIDDKYYSWAGTLNYKYDNLAKDDRQIFLKFSLVWIIFEYEPIYGTTKLYHIYKNTDPYIIQGFAVTENEPTTVALGVVDDGKSLRKAAISAEFMAHNLVSDLSYTSGDEPNLVAAQDMTLMDIENLNNTRDSIRDSILNSYNLEYDETNFIYITYGFLFTYNLEMLIDAFPDYVPTKIFTQAEIDSFYSLPENTFTGLLSMQILKGSHLEYLDQIIFAGKNLAVVKVYNLQFSKFKYVGSSCDEIIQFVGFENGDETEIYYYDFETNSATINQIDTGGFFEYITQLNVYRFQISIPSYAGPDDIWGEFIIWKFYVDIWKNPIVAGIKFVGLRILANVIVRLTAINLKFVFTTITSVLDIIFGSMRLIHGISLYFQGAYNTGIAEGIRAGLTITAGILWIVPDPTGITKVVALVITIWNAIDAAIDFFFGFDVWGAFLEFFWGIVDADPKWEILNSTLVYNQQKILSQGGFEVGDSIGVNIEIENTGNTQLTFGLKIKAGSGAYGTHKTNAIDSGDTESLIATDTFQSASPVFSLTTQADISWYYNPPGRWVVNIIPPFIWWVDPPASGDGPFYGDETTETFDMPVFPNSIGVFIDLVESGSWFPAAMPRIIVNTIRDEITPGVSERLDYELIIRPYITNRMMIISTPAGDLWRYRFSWSAGWGSGVYNLPGGASFKVWIPAWYNLKFDVRVTPTSKNPLKPGDDKLIIRIQQEDISLARKNAYLKYNVLPIIDFDVLFDPAKPDGDELYYDEIIAYFINITNEGNLADSYDVEVIDLSPDLYFLYEPGITIRPLAMYSSLIGFQIPYYQIIMPGINEFTIRVSSVTDPSVFKIYDCSIDIKEYHLIHFEVIEADLSMTDSDTYVYEFQLTNIGNVNEDLAIFVNSSLVDIATIYLENNYYPLTPGQTEYFNITLIPFELGYREFSVIAYSPWVYETIELSINVVDDDTQYPYFENFIVKDNENWLNISFIAIDELLGDDVGLSNIDIYVDGILIYSYQPTPSETIFNFSFTNDWIWTEGIHDIRVDITDADNDTISEDSLTTITYDSFEVTLDEMYKYVMWLCGEMNNYIYDNGITALYGVVTQKVVKIKNLLWEAYQLIEDGYLHTGLVRNKIAEIKLEIADTKTELMINKQSMSQEHFEYLKDCIQNIRNKIVELMGLSVGTPFSHAISLVAVDIYNLRDFVEENINATDRENLENAITLTAEKLENAIFDISLDKDTEDSLIQAMHTLDHAKAEVISLYGKGKITNELKETLFTEIIYLQTDIFVLIFEF